MRIQKNCQDKKKQSWIQKKSHVHKKLFCIGKDKELNPDPYQGNEPDTDPGLTLQLSTTRCSLILSYSPFSFPFSLPRSPS